MTDHYFDNYEWLQKRLGRFTASEIHKLFVSSKKKDRFFGDTAMSYIRAKVAELLTMEVKEESDFKQAEWGKAHEYEGVREFEKAIGRTGNYYGVANPQFFNHGKYAGGSPDWEIPDEEGADIKCPYNSAEHVKNLELTSASFPDERWEYFCQGQMNMYMRGWKVFYFVSYDPRIVEKHLKLKIITIYPDEQWVREFNERLGKAVEELERIIANINRPSMHLALIAQRDNINDLTIVEKA